VIPALARGTHDRAAHRRGDEEWLAAAWARAKVLVVAPDGTVPVLDSAAGPRLRYVEPSTVDGAGGRCFLGEHGGTPYFAVPADAAGAAAGQVPAGWRGLREVGAELADLEAGLLATAVALVGWHARHPRCPRCGEPTEVTEAGWSRQCARDGSQHWPRTDPAVIMLVHDGADRCILGRKVVWPLGRYSILAGFVEPGESLEAAVAREVAEEVGVAVTDIRYLASQPWPFPASLMLGFSARVVGDPTPRVDGTELAEARWFTRDEIRGGTIRLPPLASIAHAIIATWLTAPAGPSGAAGLSGAAGPAPAAAARPGR